MGHHGPLPSPKAHGAAVGLRPRYSADAT